MKHYLKKSVKTTVIWGSLFTVAVAGFAIQDNMDRIAWESIPKVLAPSEPVKVPAAEILAQVDKRELQCATAVIFTEARGESSKGQRAVLAVMANRIADTSGRWGNSYCEVANESSQFDGITRHGLKPAKTKKEKREFAALKNKVAQWLAFGFSNPVATADHYHASTMKKFPYWSKKMDKIAQIDQHIFYTEN